MFKLVARSVGALAAVAVLLADFAGVSDEDCGAEEQCDEEQDADDREVRNRLTALWRGERAGYKQQRRAK